MNEEKKDMGEGSDSDKNIINEDSIVSDGTMELTDDAEHEKIIIGSEKPVIVKHDIKQEKKDKKKKEKKAHKEENKKKYPHKLSFFLGLIILIFAVIGVVLIAWNSISYINSTRDSTNEYANYNSYLTSVAAVDPNPFDDITAADSGQLINIAIWSILNADTTPDTYAYSGGYMIIPAADIASSYAAIFGPETSAVHQTVQGYNCTFTYDSVANVYKIPITAITPIYTPQVTDVKQTGESLIITANYLSTESWAKDSEGNFITPQPDKIMKITLRELQGSYYIAAIQAVSSTSPETVSYESEITQPVVTETASVTETTTPTVKKDPEKTTLGGRFY